MQAAFRCKIFARHYHAGSCQLLPATLATEQQHHLGLCHPVHRPAPAQKLLWRQTLFQCLHPLVFCGSMQVGESRQRCSQHSRWRNVGRRAPGTVLPRTTKKMTMLPCPAALPQTGPAIAMTRSPLCRLQALQLLLDPFPAPRLLVRLPYEPGMEKVRLRFVSSRTRADACLRQEMIHRHCLFS